MIDTEELKKILMPHMITEEINFVVNAVEKQNQIEANFDFEKAMDEFYKSNPNCLNEINELIEKHERNYDAKCNRI